ncbi:hypothetical protein [Saccharopolyspora erythraea]|uniref:hypothetical protein n=1 Tax=Saccharopolyspora erythraea TaxID=1836 RepID=UPI0020135979|nr:hypothetical protein [Saccharopolyspora erythraea]
MERHYWQPVPDDKGGLRHAFRGRRWEGQPAAEAVCGRAVPLAQPSEMDWITFRSCEQCRHVLLAEAGVPPEAVIRSSKTREKNRR